MPGPHLSLSRALASAALAFGLAGVAQAQEDKETVTPAAPAASAPAAPVLPASAPDTSSAKCQFSLRSVAGVVLGGLVDAAIGGKSGVSGAGKTAGDLVHSQNAPECSKLKR